MTARVAVLAFLLLIPAAAHAEDPLKGVGPLIVEQPEVARKRIEAALEQYRRDDNRPQLAACYLFLGFVDMNAHREAPARANVEEAVRRFEELGDHMASWFVLMALGEHEKQNLHYESSIAIFEKALAVVTKSSAPDERFSPEGLAPFAALFGYDSLPMPQGLPPEMIKAPMLIFANVFTHDSYGSALLEAGRLDEAETQLNKARESSALFGGMFDSSLAAHIGDLHRRQWKFDEAREDYKKALAGSGMLPMFAQQGGFIEIRILDKLADIEFLSGRIGAALAWNDKALAIVRGEHDREREARLLRDRGSLLFRSTRFDAAAPVLNDALAIAVEQHDASEQGSIETDLGMLEMARGRFGTAAEHFQRSTEQFVKANEPEDAASAWMLLSQLYFATDATGPSKVALEKAAALAKSSGNALLKLLVDFTDAEERFLRREITQAQLDEVVARVSARPEAQDMMLHGGLQNFLSGIMTRGSDSPAVEGEPLAGIPTMGLVIRGKILLEKGEPSAARDLWQHALALNPSRDFRSGILALIGTSWFKEENEEKATQYFLQAADALDLALENIHVEEMYAGYAGYHTIYFDLLVELLVRRGEVDRAFDISERARARAFLQLVGNNRVEPRQSADAALIGEAESLRTQIAEWQRRATIAPDAERRLIANDLKQARLRYDAVTTQMKTSSSEYASIAAIHPTTLAEVRAALPPDTTLVSYYVTHWRIHAWIVDRTSFDHVTLPVDSAAMTRAICWAQRFDGPGRGVSIPNDTCNDPATAEDVEQMLVAPLRPKLKNRRLLILPHGDLHYIPFAALRDPVTHRYLVEDFTILYAPSASSLRFLREKESPMNGTALVLGDPFGIDGSDLPNAVWEAVHVADLLGTKALLGTDAKENALFHLDGKTDIVHIAAHGVFEADQPLYSRIALAPGDGRDGNLEVHDIVSELDLTGVNLVVLAACESARGKRSGGDDVVGLTRALLYAGTPGVISTLWRVGDDAAAALMDEFYCRLRAGDSAADALRIAQITLLSSGRFSDPRDWAAFGLTGDPQGRWPAH